jgi:hypothetical protein
MDVMRLLMLSSALLVACNSGPELYLNEVLAAYEDEVGGGFADCGFGTAWCATETEPANIDGDFRDAAACLLDAWGECRRAKAELVRDHLPDGTGATQFLYVEPSGDGQCRVTLFEHDSPGTVVRHDCGELLAQDACGLVGPAECAHVETIRYKVHPGG